MTNTKTTANSSGQPKTREHFSSRLGFILISAGCAIGLGNVGKFPYQVGQYGGAAFLVLYVVCLILIALPIMTLEFSVGRASQKSTALAYDTLEPKGSKGHRFKGISITGLYLLMMFYTTVCGGMLNYIFKEASGVFENANAELTNQVYQNMTGNPIEMIIWMSIACVVCMAICAGGVQKGVERITKVMMVLLLGIMVFLAIFAILQPGAEEGLKFYLMPDFNFMFSNPGTFCNILLQAMSLAFFTLSIGMGSMVIFGSYINKEKSLFGESITIGILDLAVAIIAGLIIFPSCFSYGVNPESGPGLVFVTLPNVFSNMPLGTLGGTLFFIFLGFAALSTVIAVFEGIIAFWMDLKGGSRIKSVIINLVLIITLSIPCVLGFNLGQNIGIPEIQNFSSIMNIEDFIVSNNLLPIGGLFLVAFCTSKRGGTGKCAIKEINTGKGIKFPTYMYYGVKGGIPIAIIFIFVSGGITTFI